jgi:hypothetical protein
MKNDICKDYGIEVPIFAFTHSPDVVIAVSNVGAMGIYGSTRNHNRYNWIFFKLAGIFCLVEV